MAVVVRNRRHKDKTEHNISLDFGEVTFWISKVSHDESADWTALSI